MGFTGFHWVLSSFTGFSMLYLVVLGNFEEFLLDSFALVRPLWFSLSLEYLVVLEPAQPALATISISRRSSISAARNLIAPTIVGCLLLRRERNATAESNQSRPCRPFGGRKTSAKPSKQEQKGAAATRYPV